MKRKAAKRGLARKNRAITTADLKKISAGLAAAANAGLFFRGTHDFRGEREFGRDINRGE